MDKRRKEKDRQNCKNKQADKKPCTQTDRQQSEEQKDNGRSEEQTERQTK